MQRALRIAIVVAAAVLGALLTRRAMQAWTRPEVAATSASTELFHYQAEVELGAGVPREDPRRMGGVLDLARSVVDRACEGDAAAIGALRDRIAERLAAPAEADLRSELSALPELCFEPPSPPGMCVWAATEIDAAGPLVGPAWALLAGCPSGVATPFFDRPDAPSLAVLDFVARRRVGVPRLRPPARLPAQYARAVIERASRPDLPWTGADLGTAVRYDDAAASEALAQAYESAPGPAERLQVLDALGRLTNARARTVVHAACEQVPTAPACAVSPATDRAEVMLDASSYVERRAAERPRVVAELDACARGSVAEGGWAGSSCLAQLATIDWARARTVASERSGGSEDPALAGLSHTLAQFPSSSDLILALRSRQLLGEPRSAETAPVTVAGAMASYGRGWTLGTGVGAGGFGHDRLARHLLHLAGLDDVDVDETPTTGGGGLAGLLGQATHLRATTHGETFAVTTAGNDELYDLDAVVGLLNVVARVRAANVRFLVVEDPLAYETIVLGPPGELASAVAEGLLTVPPAPSALPARPF